MNWDRIEGNWKQFKGKVREQWGDLTDDDLEVAAGKRENLSGKIQERYGITKEDAEKKLDEWAAKLDDIIKGK
ncbi:CsbD family protein [Chlorobaculum thiosulfatiphilum]|uniref:CsbD family protein n=1 Tax=Chlorobaculum thiosulfatiphilum TaxID=115852 RepID=A0A5C4SAA5_CHLTI|nr:CsbD family protein [Chlorobaculum thiosulfatiphilum]TNJ39879.1 CsbD family protein [Chlorobaculum thiosulfatiphilum]